MYNCFLETTEKHQDINETPARHVIRARTHQTSVEDVPRMQKAECRPGYLM